MDNKYKEKIPSVVSLAIMTSVTVIFWISFDIYRIVKKNPPLSVPPEITAPFDASLDTEALNKAAARSYLKESDIRNLAPNSSAPPEVTETSPTPTASGSATPVASASATPL